MNITLTEMSVSALRAGIRGIESEIRAVENELADQPRTGQTLKILTECMADMHSYADILRGIVARYEQQEKEQ